MLCFRLNRSLEVVEASAECPKGCVEWARKHQSAKNWPNDFSSGWIDRNDFFGLAQAGAIAKSASKNLGKVYLACDKGPYVSPRYDVIEAPAVGDEVSWGFNGDAYPLGKIKSISDGHRRIVVKSHDCSPDKVFSRSNKGLGSGWVNKGWSLIPGVVNKFNREF